jgi:hypothetical protein
MVNGSKVIPNFRKLIHKSQQIIDRMMVFVLNIHSSQKQMSHNQTLWK